MFRRIGIIVSIAAAFAGTAAFAQGRRLNGRGGNGQVRVERRLERLQQVLKLNEVQMNGFRALQENRRREAETLQQEIQQKRDALRSLLQAPSPNAAEVGNATIALKQTRERTREINQRFLSGFKGLLTPEQQQKLPKRLR